MKYLILYLHRTYLSICLISFCPLANAQTFLCEDNFYQIIGQQLYQFDNITDSYTPIGSPSGFKINAIGYSELDQVIYGIAGESGLDVLSNIILQNDIIKIDGFGDVYYVSTSTLPNNSFSSGDVSGNSLICRTGNGGGAVYSVDIASGISTYLGNGFTPRDGSIINNIFYGVHDDMCYAFDLTTNTITTSSILLCSGGIMPGGSYGASFISNNDELYVANNGTGEIFQIHNYYNFSSICASFVSNASPVSSNDGASCPSASISLGVSLEYFAGECSRLSWKISSSVNCSHFVIEQLGKDGTWKEYTIVPFSGLKEYYVNIPRSNSFSYYRLIEIDINGDQEIFNTVSVYCDNNMPKIDIIYDLLGREVNPNHYTSGYYFVIYENQTTERKYLTGN